MRLTQRFKLYKPHSDKIYYNFLILEIQFTKTTFVNQNLRSAFNQLY